MGPSRGLVIQPQRIAMGRTVLRTCVGLLAVMALALACGTAHADRAHGHGHGFHGHSAGGHGPRGGHFGGARWHAGGPARGGHWAGRDGGWHAGGQWAGRGDWGRAGRQAGWRGNDRGEWRGGDWNHWHAGWGGGWGGGWGYPGWVGAPWVGGDWGGLYWPRVDYGWNYPWFMASIPFGAVTITFGGVPYYYVNQVYYAWNPYYDGYVVTDPPPVADAPGASAPPSPQSAAGGSGVLGLHVTPLKGQSPQHAANDRYACDRWAVAQSGFNPISPRQDAQASASMRSDYRRAFTACLQARGYRVQ